MLHQNVPTVIFSHPPIGTVGLSEQNALKQHGETNVVVYRSQFTNMFYSLALDENMKLPTYFKVVCVKRGEDHVVVGIHGIGRGMDEML